MDQAIKDQPENIVRNEATMILEAHGWMVMRIGQNHVKGRTFMGRKGMPDLLACKAGRCIGVECKTATGKLSQDQLLFKQEWEGRGMVYIVYREPKNLLDFLQNP